MKNWQRILLAASATLGLSACDANNPAVTGPDPKPEAEIVRAAVESSAEGLTVKYDNRVDILFVIDNSESMEKHQTNLSRNIKKFIEAFKAVDSIDFHIAYTFVHDRTRYLADNSVVPKMCIDKKQWDDPGTLQPFLGLSDANRRFLTREDGAALSDLMSASWDPEKNRENLLKPFRNFNAKTPALCAFGPEVEESFSPVLEVLENPVLSQDPTSPNHGFRRPGAFFVAILISDAKDGAVGLSPKQGGLDERTVFNRIKAAAGVNEAGENRFRVFAVTMKPGTKLVKTCRPDFAFADPDKGDVIQEVKNKDGSTSRSYGFNWGREIEKSESPLATLAQMTEDIGGEDQVLSICDTDYGSKLATYGAKIQEDALPDLNIDLSQRFEISAAKNKDLRVYIGEDEMSDEQWDLNTNNTITIYGKKVDWVKYQNQEITIRRTPVNLTDETTRPN